MYMEMCFTFLWKCRSPDPIKSNTGYRKFYFIYDTFSSQLLPLITHYSELKCLSRPLLAYTHVTKQIPPQMERRGCHTLTESTIQVAPEKNVNRTDVQPTEP